MSQRQMPSGQGPARGNSRGSATHGRATSHPRAEAAGRAGAAGATGPTAPARRTKAPRPPRRLSGRAAALGLLLVALVLAYAYPVRQYLGQQAEIAQLQRDQAAQRAHIQQLMASLKQWDDPDYVAEQARVRLQLVHVGEKIYIVKSDDASTARPGAAGESSWLNQLWSSVQSADDPPVS